MKWELCDKKSLMMMNDEMIRGKRLRAGMSEYSEGSDDDNV